MQKHISSAAMAAIFIGLSIGFEPLADADGLYFGGGAYLNRAEVKTLDDTDKTFAFQVGYNFIDTSLLMLSLELGAYDLGQYSENGVEVEADAIGLAAVGNLPLGPFIELYAKIGAAEVNVEVDNNKFDDTEIFRGAGVSIDIFDTIDLYLEYLEFDTEVDSTSVGVGIRFDLF